MLLLYDFSLQNNQSVKSRKKNIAMGWLDYKKAYDMVPHPWILECLKLFGAAENIRSLLENSMKSWRTELTSNGQTLGTVSIKRGIFQGDSLSPLLFVVTMIPLTLILRKCEAGYLQEIWHRKMCCSGTETW